MTNKRVYRVLTWIYLMAEARMDRLDVFLSSGVAGSCRLRSSKHSFRCARRFFSSLLWTSLVPARGADPLPLPLLLPLLPTDGGEGICGVLPTKATEVRKESHMRILLVATLLGVM